MRENDTEGNDSGSGPAPGSLENYGEADDGQDYVDRSVVDFDPADGLLSGTAIDGTSDIPDPDAVADDASSTDSDSRPKPEAAPQAAEEDD